MLRLVFLLVSSIFIAAESSVPRLSRIVKGTLIEIESVPYQAALISGGSLVCGGSIISQSFILTAANCVFDVVNILKYC